MIEIKEIVKIYDKKTAVNNISMTFQTGSLIGLVGSNGAGKSTLLRILCGLNNPTNGSIVIDGEGIDDNVNNKKQIFFLPDNSYFFPGATIKSTAEFYKVFYPRFDYELFVSICEMFDLTEKMKITSLSKGMKKQVMLIIAICAKTKYLVLDEAFDGIDAITRQTFKEVFMELVHKNNITVIIATHNIREIEDICDIVCLIYKANLVFCMPIEELRKNYHKVKLTFGSACEHIDLEHVKIFNEKTEGNNIELSVNAYIDQIEQEIKKLSPVSSSLTPMSLEEIFICELKERGYDIKTKIKGRL